MILCSDVLAEGMRDHGAGKAFTANPYPAPRDPVTYERVVYRVDDFGRSTPIGITTVRIGFDWREWWELGWNLAEYVAIRDGKQPKLGDVL